MLSAGTKRSFHALIDTLYSLKPTARDKEDPCKQAIPSFAILKASGPNPRAFENEELARKLALCAPFEALGDPYNRALLGGPARGMRVALDNIRSLCCVYQSARAVDAGPGRHRHCQFPTNGRHLA